MRKLTKDELVEIVKEKSVFQYFLLSKILSNIPDNSHLARKTKSGLIKTNLPNYKYEDVSLNTCLNLGTDVEFIQEFISTLEERLSHCDFSTFMKMSKH